jgi:tryptophan 2,3-dioxygenase
MSVHGLTEAGRRRARHVQMVERQIGTKSGAGGSAGARRICRNGPRCRYDPPLWELRAAVTRKRAGHEGA